MHTKTIAELKNKILNKEISCVELTKYFLMRIKNFDQKLNSFITITEDHALKNAANHDESLAKGEIENLPLLGIPIAHKDIFCTTGSKTTCASKMLDTFIAPYNATIVSRLEQAGCIMLGKNNMDEFAMGSSNENSYYGNVKNPWNLQKVPGGSSGGSAAAVAARIIPAATGSDTGGSVRQPAALTGICGLKPTYGRASRYGMIAFASSLDTPGIMACNAEDLALLLNVIAGHDPKDATSVNMPVPDYCATLNTSLKGLKIGLPKEYFIKELDIGITIAIDEAISVLEKLGAAVKEISLPSADLATASYYIIAPAECSSNLARFDGVRYGYRCANPRDLGDLYTRSRSEGFGGEVKRRIMIGTYMLSAGYYDAYYLQAQKIRRLISDDFQKAFADVDIILGPTTPTPAFHLGENAEDLIKMYLSDIYTIAANLAGIPAISLPAGFVDEMPVGIQLIGNYFCEAKLLNIAHQFQKETDWHARVPEGF